MASRWWTYQRERFPVLGHGTLVLLVSLSAVVYSSHLRGEASWPDPQTLAVASICAFLFFLQLRVLDEWKDYEEDRRYRPYRPVPRGLVMLRELSAVGGVAAAAQLALVVWLGARLVPVLLAVWLYMVLMGKEFFLREWLKARPIAYLWTHMLIMPLIYLFLIACDWRGAPAPHWTGIGWLLLVGFFNGVVIEIGRKVRAPQQEEPGVETYSVLWGRRNAVCAWSAAVVLCGAAAGAAEWQIRVLPIGEWLIALGLLMTFAAGVCFLAAPSAGRAKLIESASALWTLLVHLSLGPVALLLSPWLAARG